MSNIFKNSLFSLVFVLNIFCDQALYSIESPMVISDIDVCSELVKFRNLEGFLSGTPVKTLEGYMPIEQLQIGDCIVGTEGEQEIINIKKVQTRKYVAVQLASHYIFSVPSQQFYLQNQTIKNKSIMMHIFRNKEGHMLDTPSNRAILRNLVRNANNYLGKYARDNHWYAKVLKKGKQLWAWVRNNMIRDGGLNETPRSFNGRTGLCKDLGL